MLRRRTWPFLTWINLTQVRNFLLCLLTVIVLRQFHYIKKIKAAYTKANIEGGFLRNNIDKISGLNKQLVQEKKHKQTIVDYVAHDLTGMIDGLMDSHHYTKGFDNNYIVHEQMLQLIQNMVVAQQQQGAHLTVNKEWQSLENMVNRAIVLVSAKSNAKKISVTQSIPEVLVYADEGLITRVLFNLLMNAVKFSEKGSVIEIYAGISKDTCKVVIKDHGKGIAPTHLHQIFTPHFQVSKSRNGVSRGLGLTYCKKVMEAHGNKIDVQSTIGQGTVFTLSFEARPTAKAKNTPVSMASQMDIPGFMRSLSTTQKHEIQKYATLMNGLKVYQASKIRSVLTGINNEGKPYLSNWKSAIVTCLEHCDEDNYKNLLKL